MKGDGGGDGSGTFGRGCCGCSGSTEKNLETASSERPLLLLPRPWTDPFPQEETVTPEMVVDWNSRHSFLLLKIIQSLSLLSFFT